MKWCPRCNAVFSNPPVVGNKDGHTNLLLCGLIEGLEATGMKSPYGGPQYWTVDQRVGKERGAALRLKSD